MYLLTCKNGLLVQTMLGKHSHYHICMDISNFDNNVKNYASCLDPIDVFDLCVLEFYLLVRTRRRTTCLYKSKYFGLTDIRVSLKIRDCRASKTCSNMHSSQAWNSISCVDPIVQHRWIFSCLFSEATCVSLPTPYNWIQLGCTRVYSCTSCKDCV